MLVAVTDLDERRLDELSQAYVQNWQDCRLLPLA